VDYSGRSGSLFAGKKYVMHAGDIMIIPPNVPHEFRFTQEGQ
jgi:quercetin dioxygenase-like cupin family protein